MINGYQVSDYQRMKCSHCNKAVKFPTSKIGASAKCPGCRKAIKLQAAGELLLPATTVDASIPKETPSATPALRPKTKPPAFGVPSIDARDEIASTHDVSFQTVVDSRISRFISDGQQPKVVAKLLGRVDEICTSNETPEYAAVQHLPGVLSPDAIVLTNRRVIIFRAKALGRMNMVDVPWMDIADIHIKEGVVGATLSVRGANGHTEVIDHLPKKQARCVYRVGQEREQEMREFRRVRKMEEDRNAAGGVVVNTSFAAPPSPYPTPANDLTSRLGQLKQMLDADLISQSEFETKKAEILASL
ncbi:hypothetical protein K227x_41350 [Rubripirellula lacrimiformis]|uniref:YokE-like PH domain-containing protein n=1 Tax=Rubripirellula lacrimiformis TaxID=1930273 RepID=A0A517NF26_9BACT|nr:PH domain-containing protein [Rubripirellula lacrimiformis]QDT05732.1 hypothetical protein K227x_41350 [Rubripirellula lacrimiformis]